MRKTVLSVLALTLLSSSVFATQPANTYDPVTWTSNNSSDKKSISVEKSVTQTFTVLVSAANVGWPTNPPIASTGVNISNCGTVTHIDAGSSVLCSLGGTDGPTTITVASDKSDVFATGSFQVLLNTTAKSAQ